MYALYITAPVIAFTHTSLVACFSTPVNGTRYTVMSAVSSATCRAGDH